MRIGYREFLLPFLGSDYIKREYEEGSYANDQDRISFNDFFAPCLMLASPISFINSRTIFFEFFIS